MTELVCGVGFVGLILAVFFGFRRRSVAEGYVVRIRRNDKHARVQHAGSYTLWPSEEESEPLLVRQRETSLTIPGIFTHGGLPVDVNLAFSMSLDTDKMNNAELYYTDGERQTQQIRIMYAILRKLVAEAPPPDVVPADGISVKVLFSPFGGKEMFDLCEKFQQQASSDLAKHGIIIDVEGCMIQNLDLPPDIVNAYMETFSRGFEGASRTDFIRRIRTAAPDMSDAGLVSLYNAINNNPGEARTIFTSGTYTPDLRVRDQDLSIGIRAAASSAAPPAAAPAPPPAASTPASPPPPAVPVLGRSIPGSLTEEDLQLLKPLLDVTI